MAFFPKMAFFPNYEGYLLDFPQPNRSGFPFGVGYGPHVHFGGGGILRHSAFVEEGASDDVLPGGSEGTCVAEG